MDIFEHRQLANALRKQGEYDKAVGIYEAIWNNNPDERDEWDGWGYASCLRKVGRSEEALDICRGLYPQHKDSAPLRSLYAWCVYDTELKKDDDQIDTAEANFFRAAIAITKLALQDEFSPYTRTVFKVLKHLDKADGPYRADAVLEWTAKLDREKLSTECRSFKDSAGRERENASELEDWYRLRTKALEKAGRAEECRALCEEALRVIPEHHRFHNDSDVWFSYRIGKSDATLQDTVGAIASLEKVVTRKKDWFVRHELAEQLYASGKLNEALAQAIDAAIAADGDENSSKLYELMARIFYEKEEQELGDKHLLLAYRMRKSKGWKAPREMEQAVRDIGRDKSLLPSLKELLAELKKYWLDSKPRVKGKIDRLVSEKGFGFIAGEDGVEYYFKTKSFRGDSSRLAPGLAVQFWPEKVVHPKTKEDTAVAVRITPV